MEFLLLTIFTLLNTMLVLSETVQNLMNRMIDFNEICDIHYNYDVTDSQLKTTVGNGFEFILNSVVISNNVTIKEDLYDIRGEMVQIFENGLSKAEMKYKEGNSLEARDGCR